MKKQFRKFNNPLKYLKKLENRLKKKSLAKLMKK